MKIKRLALIGLLSILLVSGVACGVGAPNAYSRYDADRDKIQYAVLAYKGAHDGLLPKSDSLAGIDIGNKEYDLIDICTLVSNGFLDEVPESCSTSHAGGNCVEGTCSCNPSGHYIWGIDDGGYIYSACIGSDSCSNAEMDGFQGVYP